MRKRTMMRKIPRKINRVSMVSKDEPYDVLIMLTSLLVLAYFYCIIIYHLFRFYFLDFPFGVLSCDHKCNNAYPINCTAECSSNERSHFINYPLLLNCRHVMLSPVICTNSKFDTHSMHKRCLNFYLYGSLNY